MMADGAHSTRIAVTGSPPTEVEVGDEIVLMVTVSCPHGCELDGATIQVTAPDASVATGALAGRDAAGEAIGALAFKAPREVGQHAWRVAFPSQEIAGIRHEESTASVSVSAKPHTTSLAVWAIPSSVVTGECFAIKVGAKSSGACGLAGERIEVCDRSGSVAARGSLGAAPWPGTSALYWAEVELVAPPADGISAWSVRFEPKDVETAHDGTSSQFQVAVVRPPEHTLTLKVVEKDTAAPIDSAQVRLGSYRAETDRSGHAEVRVAKGRYDINVWKVGYDAPVTTVDIDDDAAVEVAVLAQPQDDPDSVWTM
jgi:hypothetical protein